MAHSRLRWRSFCSRRRRFLGSGPTSQSCLAPTAGPTASGGTPPAAGAVALTGGPASHDASRPPWPPVSCHGPCALWAHGGHGGCTRHGTGGGIHLWPSRWGGGGAWPWACCALDTILGRPGPGGASFGSYCRLLQSGAKVGAQPGACRCVSALMPFDKGACVRNWAPGACSAHHVLPKGCVRCGGQVKGWGATLRWGGTPWWWGHGGSEGSARC